MHFYLRFGLPQMSQIGYICDMNNASKTTIIARAFLRLDGPVYAVVYASDHSLAPVAQGVFKTERAAKTMASKMGGRVVRGEFSSEYTIAPDWDGDRAEAQMEANSRDRMRAHREHIEHNRNPWVR